MKALNKICIALLLLVASFSLALVPTALAAEDDGQEVETTEEVVVVDDDNGMGDVLDDVDAYPIIESLIAMKDADLLIVRMKGVLDRYDGVGHLDDCDDYELYFSFLDSFYSAFVFEGRYAPADWQDVLGLAAAGAAKGLTSSYDIIYHCRNGTDVSLSTHNLTAAQAGLDEAHEMMVVAINSTAARMGVDPESVPSSIAGYIDVDLTQEELDELAEIFGLAWDAEVFFEDLKITSELVYSLGGWLDRLIAGQTVGCGEYYINILLLSEPVIFINPPPTWKPLYEEHISIIYSIFDTNSEIIDICINDGDAPTEFIVFKAREGIANAQDRLHLLKQNTAARLGVPY